MEKSIEVPQKTRNRVAIWSSNPTPGDKPGQNYNLKRYTHLYADSSTIYNSQDMETAWTSINRWMNKEDVVHIYNGISLSHKKSEIMPSAATLMNCVKRL